MLPIEYISHQLCNRCKKVLDNSKNNCFDCIKKRKEYYLQYSNIIKTNIFNMYGKVCNCCGLDDLSYMTIDHINGGGCKHIKDIGGNLYKWLNKQEKLDTFQSLCYNCNCAKGVFGSCPHNPNFKWREVKYLKSRRSLLRAKLSVLEHYGKKCCCCGEDTFEFLTMDHINKDGAKHRKLEKYSSIYYWLRTNNYPSNFRILCWNCNFISYRKECIHSQKVEIPTYSVWPTIESINSTKKPFYKTTILQCPYGHKYDSINTMHRGDGSRECKTCKSGWARQSNARKKAKEMGLDLTSISLWYKGNKFYG